ncbi:MAG: AMP-binding protein [Deltaproteobacteria bacterium]|nr:AMP-binding protein [Deltaproteobacteria bacterium]
MIEKTHKDMILTREQIYREKGDTWPKILKYNFEKYGDTRKAMRYKHYGIWQPCTWKDYYTCTKYLALGLISLGFEPGDRLIIIGDNAPEWYYFELAAQANHGASVGLYSESTPSEIKYVAENSEARFAVVQDQEQVDKFLEIKDQLPFLKTIIYWNYKGLAHYEDPILMGHRQVIEIGKEYEIEHPGLFEQNVQRGKADDVCAIVYTSGTTGDVPKGAIHTYGTLMSGALYCLILDPWSEKDSLVPHLPPAWITEQWFLVGCHLLSANTLNFAEAPETHQRDTNETGPSIVICGARIWESKAAMVHARILNADTIKKLAFRLLMPVGYRLVDKGFQKIRVGVFLKMLYAFASAVLFRPIKKSLGLLNARICYTTGGVLSPDVLRFYHAIGVPLKNTYMTTEGGALTGAKEDDIRLDTVGPVHDGAEVKIADNGEILYRQPGIFVGYCKDPDGTSEALEGGWFHSGDSGFIKEDGHLVIVDRVNDIIEMATGDKVSPQLIESRLRFSPFIKDVWVFASHERDYVSAIVIIDHGTVQKWAGKRKIASPTFASLSQHPEVLDLIRKEIDTINQTLPSGARIKRYVNLHKEFSPDDGELTRTRKLRRKFLEKHYKEIIRAIYDEREEVGIEAKFRHRDGRTEVRKAMLKISSAGEVTQ